jgi:hypothetical protein
MNDFYIACYKKRFEAGSYLPVLAGKVGLALGYMSSEMRKW